MRNIIVLLILVVAGMPFTQSCGKAENVPPPGTTQIKQLIAEHRAPVEIVSFGVDSNLVVRRFRLTLKNVCDKPVKMVRWTQLFFDADGKLLADGKRDGGIAEVSAVAPGETYEGVMIVNEKAAKGRLVVKSVTYESLPPGTEDNPTMQMYKIDFVWKNPDHDATVRALTQGAGHI